MKLIWDIRGPLSSDWWARLLYSSHHTLHPFVSWRPFLKVEQSTLSIRAAHEEASEKIGSSFPRGSFVLYRRTFVRSMSVAAPRSRSSDDNVAYTACRLPKTAEAPLPVERFGVGAVETPAHQQLPAATYRAEAGRAASGTEGGSLGDIVVSGTAEFLSRARLSSGRGGGAALTSSRGALDFAEVYLPGSRLRPSESLRVNRIERKAASSGGFIGDERITEGGPPSSTSTQKKPRSARRQRELPPLLSATDAAVAHIKEIVNSYNERLKREEASGAVARPRACGIRVSLKKHGCSGMAYDVAICTEGPLHGANSPPSTTEVAPVKGVDPVPGGPTGTLKGSKNWREDEVIKVGEVEIRVAADAVMMLVGTQVDFVDEEVQTGFVFNNPNQKQSCGCGKSFMV